MKINNSINISNGIYYILLLLILLPFSGYTYEKPDKYVNPLIGTSNSRWMIFPGPTMPFGMVKLSPDNQDEGWKAGYEYSINNIMGFSHIHSWTMSGLLVMPTVGNLVITPGPENAPEKGYRSRFSHENEKASIGYYSVILDDYNIKAELSATERCGFFRFTYPKSDTSRILFDLKFPSEYGFIMKSFAVKKVNNYEIEGYVDGYAGRDATWNDYRLNFVIRLNKPFDSMGAWANEDIEENVKEISFDNATDGGFFVNFKTKANEKIVMKTGISYVSIEQARLNLDVETKSFGFVFDKVVEHAKNVWNELLNKIEVQSESTEDKIKFYTNMYRAYAGRAIFSDVNGLYKDMCEITRRAKIENNPVYGSDAFWNTFWNLNGLWTLVSPEIAKKWINSFLEIYSVGGWLPKGPTGIEYSGIMVGEHTIELIVSAYQKGIREFDVELAYKAMKEVQMIQGGPFSCGGKVGNPDLNVYMKYGYVPYEDGPTSNTLDYAFDDWAVSQLALALDKYEDYQYFLERSKNYLNVFNNEYKYVWMKKRDGTWVDDFKPLCCTTFNGPGFVEGNPWQYTFYVPHDIKNIVSLLGTDEFNKRLEEGFETSKKYNFSALMVTPDELFSMGLLGDWYYGLSSLEQSQWAEMVAMNILPINFNNQPNMQAPYLFNYAGKSYLTQKWVREIMDNFYGTTPLNGWLGDEDEGQMGAWFVMSAMGLFEMDGGASIKPQYDIGSPIFDKVIIHLDKKYYSDKEFIIKTVNNSKENKYIQKATLNGKPLNGPNIYHSDIVSGGQLLIYMGEKPNNKWGIDNESIQ
jgi:predicted alpha-1,2-mannosidase